MNSIKSMKLIIPHKGSCTFMDGDFQCIPDGTDEVAKKHYEKLFWIHTLFIETKTIQSFLCFL